MTDSTPDVLRIAGLTKRYRKILAVDALDLTIGPGEFVGLIGPNGAGKSTTMNCIAGNLVPDEGQIALFGTSVIDQPVKARRNLGFVPQDLHLYGYLTGEEYLRFIADVRGVAGDAQTRQIDELLELAELSAARNRLVKEYSGGMARKLAICSALVGAPKLLLLDESFVGLDPESTYRIRQRLVRHCEDGGAIVLSSHILDMLERICTRIVMLVEGQRRVDAPMEQLRDAFVAGTYRDLTHLYLAETGKLEDPTVV